MSTLLVPIDFSENALVAAKYALEIAQQQQHKVDFIHIFISHTNQFANAQIHPDLVDPAVEEAKQKMTAFMAQIPEENRSLIQNILYRDGILSEQIEIIAEKKKYSTIVMGTKGASGLASILLGSNTYDVINTASRPVLAIPLNTHKFQANHIAVLCNFKEAEIEVLNQAVELIGKEIAITLFHINSKHENIDVLDKKLQDWIHYIIQKTGISDISYVIKQASYFANSKESIAKGIQSMLRDQDIDLILITKSKKSFFQQLTTENIIKSLAFEISIPNFFAKT